MPVRYAVIIVIETLGGERSILLSYGCMGTWVIIAWRRRNSKLFLNGHMAENSRKPHGRTGEVYTVPHEISVVLLPGTML